MWAARGLSLSAPAALRPPPARTYTQAAALASSSRRAWIEATLEGLGIARHFPVVVSGDDVARGKPAPDSYLLAAERLCVPARRCLAVEESPNGIAAPSAAGMRVLAVRTPYTAHLPLDGADVVVDSLRRLDPAAFGLPARR